MSKPLNWMLAGATAKKTVSRSLRNRLAATTILAVVPFLGYGREAFAICDVTSAPDITCTGSIAGASLNYNNANVTTVAPFEVTDDGLYIDGFGDIRFTDNAGSTITNDNYAGTGLRVESDGPDGGTPGAVTIITNATITGSGSGIAAFNRDFSGTGGDLTITVNGNVTATDVDEALDDDLIVNDGIHARNYGNSLTITTGAGSTVTGEHNAIDARNFGRGDLTINAYGALTSNEYDGVFARNHRGADNLYLTVGAQSVINGAGNGIHTQNFGHNNLEITVDGRVTGHGYDGIRALNVDGEYYNSETEETYFGDGGDLKITTGAESIIRGDDNGIDARNFGDGSLDITADGYVTGDAFDGIYARNDGVDLTITTGVDSVVRGAGRGITANNTGWGDLTITANGWVGGYANEDGDGIRAINSGDSGALTITTGAASTVRGADDGIHASNFGDGGLTITANGVVRGEGDGTGGPTYNYGAGIRAFNAYGATEDEETGYYNALTITTGAASQVTGQSYGIIGINRGFGDFTVTANGRVLGKTASGISAINYEDGQDLIIETGSGSVVTGLRGDGIYAYQNGNGILDITVNGVATGKTDEYEDYDSYGVEAVNRIYFGSTSITVGAGGVAQGQEAGIASYHSGPGEVGIYNDGVVRNLSGESHDRAISARGGDIYVQNNADIVGTVYFDPFAGKDLLMDNNSLWNPAGGASFFGGGSEDTVNNAGVVLAADDPATAEKTVFNGLEFFNNNGGLVSLVDGQEGDFLAMNGTDGTKYEGTDGHLAVDTALGAGGPDDGLSDELIINGFAAGTTTIHVNVVAANGVNLDGIPVVRVQGGGTADAGNFVLDGPVNGGFFSWGLRFDDTNPNDLLYELFTLTDASGNPIPGGGAYEFPAGLAATQDIWLQTASTALQRQADLRSLLTGIGVTPVADFGEEVEPTPIEPTITPGFWYKAFASYAESDDEQNGFTLDRNQTTYGGMAGFDFGTQSVGDAMMFGIFGGYIASDLEFESSNSDWSFEGPTVGAYATYIDQSLYIDATVKADFLDIKVDPDDLASAADDADTDALNVGARVDAGYKFGRSVYIEPQATLAVVYTDIDDLDIFGGTVEFENETNVRGRLGMRLGVDHRQDDATVYSADATASVWEDFSDDTDVTIVDTGIPDFGVSDNPASTYGDLSLGLSVANPDGWSAFMRGNYLFADDYEAVAGSAGVRISW